MYPQREANKKGGATLKFPLNIFNIIQIILLRIDNNNDGRDI
jgi:hypothetical protein